MAEDTPTNGGGEGFRITLGVVYTEQQAQGRSLADLKADFRLLTQQIQLERTERERERLADKETMMLRDSRIEKLEDRLKGILVTLGTGMAVGVIAYFQGVFG